MTLKPFTLKVFCVRATWSGKIKRELVHEQSYAYPEPMLADASIARAQGFSVWTFEPEPGLWSDDRPPTEDNSVSQVNERAANGKKLPF